MNLNLPQQPTHLTIRSLSGLVSLCAILVLAACGPDNAKAPPPALALPGIAEAPVLAGTVITREAYFAEPVQFQGRISPDGAKVSWLALSDGALNLFVADADGKSTPKQYTFGSNGVELHRWTPNSAYILFVQAMTNSEATRVFALNVQTGLVRNLVAVEEGDNVWLAAVSKNWPNTALVRLRRAGEPFYDLYRVELESGEKTLIAKNPGFEHWVTDSEFVPRLGIKTTPDGGQIWMLLGTNGEETPLLVVSQDDVSRTRPQQMDATSTSLYLIDGRDGPFSSFTRIDLQTGEHEVLAIGEGGDITQTLFHPVTDEPLAYFTNGPTPHWQALASGFQPILDRLQQALGPRFFILAATNTAEQLVIYSDRPEHPGLYSLYDLQTDTITTFFETMPMLAHHSLVPTRVMNVQTRDGFTLVSYFTAAHGDTPHAAPLVVLPQTYLNSRIPYGFNPRTQWLSNRGYNVLEVNTRGASGLGRAYADAGAGAGMLLTSNDLADAIQAIVNDGLASATHIAGLGWDAGARTVLALAAAKDTPLRCAVVIDPVLDFEDMIKRAQQQGSSARVTRWLKTVPTLNRYNLVKAASPTTYGEKTRARLLLLHTSANSLLNIDIARAFVGSVRAGGGKAALVNFPEIDKKSFDGPAFLPMAALSELFLADCLGGRAEPIGNALEDVTLEVNAGAQGVAGLDLH